MKIRKYSVAALGIVVILLVTAWFLRNSIIERISNPLLEQYDVKVTDVSLDALATSNASISYLEVEHINGTVIEISDLKLPIGTSPNEFRTYSAAKISIALPPSDDEQPDLARMMEQIIELPLRLPNYQVIVAELSTPPYPTLRELSWQSRDNNQQLTAVVDSTLLTTTIRQIDETKHTLEVSIADVARGTAEQSISVTVRQFDDRISLNGTSTLQLPLWMSLSTSLGNDRISVRSGTATMRFDTQFLHDPVEIPGVNIDFAPTSPIQLTYARSPGDLIAFTLESADRFEIVASIPDLRWNFRQKDASLLLSYQELSDIQLSLVNLSCNFTATCESDFKIVLENAALPFASVERLQFTGAQSLQIREDGTSMQVAQNAALNMTGVSDPDLELARFDALLTSASSLRLLDDGWEFKVQSADVIIEDYAALDGVTFSAPVFLDDVSFRESNEQLFAKIGVYASSSQLNWNNQIIRLPGFKGGLGRQNEALSVILETDGLFAEASIEGSHNLDSGIGQLSLIDAGISFDSQALSNRVSPWANEWDIVAGDFATDLQAEWRKQDTEWYFSGRTSIRLRALSGAWNDTAFAGLTTDLDASFDTVAGIAVQPSSLEISLVDMGLPVENITADYTPHPNELSVDVENLSMTAFGGSITADPFSFSTESARNTLLLHARSIELAEILSIKEFESIEVSGRIGAELPVTIEGKNVTVIGGTLTGEPPGGVIRYLPGASTDEADLSALGLATRALSNFEYETLTSEVEYSTNGDLNLQMRLTGRNPDLEDSRPVVLNLGVENNIPQMLRSLQATRAVEEILERRLAQ